MELSTDLTDTSNSKLLEYKNKVQQYKNYQSLRFAVYFLCVVLCCFFYLIPHILQQELIIVFLVCVIMIIYVELKPLKRPKFHSFHKDYLQSILVLISEVRTSKSIPVDHRLLGTNWPRVVKWIRYRYKKEFSIDVDQVKYNNKINFIRLKITKNKI